VDRPEPTEERSPSDEAPEAPREDGASATPGESSQAGGETPQTAALTATSSDGAPRKGKELPTRARIALALVGGAALVAAVVVPLAVGSGNADPATASAAPIAATFAGSGAMVDEAAPGANADPGAPHETGPARPPTWRVAQLADSPDVTLVDFVVARRPLLTALGAAGLPRAEAQRVARSLDEVRDIDHFGAKDTFVVARDKSSGRVVAYEVASSPTDVWQAREQTLADGTNKLVARKLELSSERVRVRKAVVVGPDLRASFTEAGLGPTSASGSALSERAAPTSASGSALSERAAPSSASGSALFERAAPLDDILSMLDDALEGHAELSDIRAGARLRLVATQERVEGAFARWVSLEAVEYFPATPTAPPVRVYFLGGEDERPRDRRGWYDARGRQPYNGGWRSPTPLARIASRFNPHRMHPVLHVVMPHNGVDFAAPSGAPVYATAAGVVVSAGNGGPCGNMVEIAHPGGITSVYCHLSRFAAGLHVGQHVESRQLIAYVGQTGRVTGPHLHFGIKKNGVFIDPMTLRLDGVRVVPRARRDEFDRLRAALDAELDAIPLPAPGASTGPPEPSEPSETFYEEPP
jgi:murein DD-endopeptidase MepM/ murein hydrolase activator NlpD